MSSRLRTRKPAAKTKRWRASLIRKQGQLLGIVEAPTRQQAEAAAIRAFMLNEQQRGPLVVQEYD